MTQTGVAVLAPVSPRQLGLNLPPLTSAVQVAEAAPALVEAREERQRELERQAERRRLAELARQRAAEARSVVQSFD
jgi:hypothetical protein